MTTPAIVDDFADNAARLRELEQRRPLHRPHCFVCNDTGWNYDWPRLQWQICTMCHNQAGLPQPYSI